MQQNMNVLGHKRVQDDAPDWPSRKLFDLQGLLASSQ